MFTLRFCLAPRKEFCRFRLDRCLAGLTQQKYRLSDVNDIKKKSYISWTFNCLHYKSPWQQQPQITCGAVCLYTSRYLCNSPKDSMADNRYVVGYAKLGTSGCKKCKQKIEKKALRIGKVVTNPFSDEGGDMKQWYHPQCIFETFKRARATTKKIEEPDDLEGFTELEQEDKDAINKLIKEFVAGSSNKTPSKSPAAKKSPAAAKVQSSLPFSPSKPKIKDEPDDDAVPSTSSASNDESMKKDDAFREFRRLCAEIADESSYNSKTQIVKKFITKGPSGSGFEGDVYLWLKLLLPGVVKRVYNLNSKQLVKLFSQIFGTNLQDMIADLDQGDVPETVRIFFEQSKRLLPQKKSNLSMKQVDSYLEQLSQVTKEDDQQRILTSVAKRCTGNDLKMFIRLVKHDLRINAGAKHILDALDENAYAAFQASRNLEDVVDRVMGSKGEGVPGMKKKLSIRTTLMTPVKPMLAEACRSIGQAMKKCPNGFYAEIKYDGERVQVHKNGDKFQYFSRSLKPVQPHKVEHFKEFIPKAFPTGDDIILDAEVLLVDTNTNKPLPFGTLGVHKKAAFHDANVCLFIFDCLFINGDNIMDKPIKERRKLLQDSMTEIPNRILFSEMQYIKEPDDLQGLLNRVFKEGLEGLVLKDINSTYKPGKRHWLKVKKDYLMEGTMADSADLVVLGAYYGTGNKGGIMSIFLLGCYDDKTEMWCTVTKCHSGLDDKTLEELQTLLDMVKISKDPSKIPKWLNIKKTVVPDFVTADPKKAPVWEIAGAEFSKAEIHTADGISIRFPRIAKFRDDKTWETATNLSRLKELFKKSKETTDVFPEAKGGKKKSDENGNASGSDSDTDVNSDGEDGTGSPKKQVSPTKKAGPLDMFIAGAGKSSSDSPKKGAVSPKTTPVKAVKRKGSDDNNAVSSPSPSKKAMCKYGANCYQKNPKHLQQFAHGSKKLPTIFHGCKIYLSKTVEQFRNYKRFIVGWDGDLVQDYDKTSATHMVIPAGQKGTGETCAGVCVSEDWLRKCIKSNALVPTEPYIIR